MDLNKVVFNDTVLILYMNIQTRLAIIFYVAYFTRLQGKGGCCTACLIFDLSINVSAFILDTAGKDLFLPWSFYILSTSDVRPADIVVKINLLDIQR